MADTAIDLFCGLGGWSDGFLAEGYDVIGFDIERHDYGTGGYPGQLVLQDVHTIHGSQFRNAACIVASPPCQEFSYMAMPWSRAKQIAAALRGDYSIEGLSIPFPEGYKGSQTKAELTALFDACFRIQREACTAAGRYVPMIVENVKGAQPWVGPAKANYGSFYLWGDVGMVGNRVVCRAEFGNYTAPMKAQKVTDYSDPRRNGGKGAHLTCQVENDRRNEEGRKVPGLNFHEHEKTGKPGRSFQSAAVATFDRRDSEGTKQGGNWWHDPQSITRRHSSKSSARKAASAQIAKIPFGLSSYIARAFKPYPATNEAA